MKRSLYNKAEYESIPGGKITGFLRAFQIVETKLDFWILESGGNISETKRATGDPLVAK